MSHPFTDEYIKMAKAAEEIQAMRLPFIEGDAVFVHEWNKPAFVGLLRVSTFQGLWSGHHDAAESDLVAFWLPRLDQLLGMLGNAHDFARHLRSLSYEEANIEDTGECREWHELALAVVMREKYGKKWDGERWVKA